MITLYGLRHTSASLMAAMGVPLVLASKALGHSNIKTTATTYTHLYDESQGMIAEAFGKKFKGIYSLLQYLLAGLGSASRSGLI